MLISAIMIKAYDGGPVIYKQERVTIGGRSFMIYKFRSMRIDSEQHGAQLATRHDSRITPVGHVLRNLHFDELPQLFNVLKGDMSIVGPRPERREIMRKYEKEIPEFYYRLKVKAGLTGYAQVYGKYNTVPYDKLKLDLFYIQNYSLWLDIKLMFMTFRILFQKETSEGVNEDQTTALTEEEVRRK
jgi:lipopolysaccharide/colanic/teichoic acid biosynthesis glycosyltransferase